MVEYIEQLFFFEKWKLSKLDFLKNKLHGSLVKKDNELHWALLKDVKTSEADIFNNKPLIWKNNEDILS